MECVEFRRMCLTEGIPHGDAAVQHRAHCSGCGHFYSEFQRFTKLLEKATAVNVPEGLEARVKLRQSFSRPLSRRPYTALAASILVLVVGGLLWLRDSTEVALKDAVFTHYLEPHVVLSEAVQPLTQQKVIRNLGGTLSGSLSNVLFANLCVVRGQPAGHFVVHHGGTEVVILIMPHEEVLERHTHREATNAVHLIPMERGSLGIVASVSVQVEPIEQEIKSRISWEI